MGYVDKKKNVAIRFTLLFNTIRKTQHLHLHHKDAWEQLSLLSVGNALLPDHHQEAHAILGESMNK